MTTPRTIDDYGGIKVNVGVVEIPVGEMGADEDMRRSEDLAQLTRPGFKAWVRWQTTTTAGPALVTPTGGGSQMGVGSAQLPAITKMAFTGIYQITYPSDWTDALDEVEPIVFTHGTVDMEGSTMGHAQITAYAGSIVVVQVTDMTGAASDLSGNGVVCLHLG